jgi:hypothetical protein
MEYFGNRHIYYYYRYIDICHKYFVYNRHNASTGIFQSISNKPKYDNQVGCTAPAFRNQDTTILNIFRNNTRKFAYNLDKQIHRVTQVRISGTVPQNFYDMFCTAAYFTSRNQ